MFARFLCLTLVIVAATGSEGSDRASLRKRNKPRSLGERQPVVQQRSQHALAGESLLCNGNGPSLLRLPLVVRPTQRANVLSRESFSKKKTR